MNFNPAAATRLDNKRIVGSSEDNAQPIVVVTKSYARLNAAACVVLGVVPGQDSVEFVQDTESGSFAFYKATQSTEEGAARNGKKVAADGTISSESIYKRLEANTTYKVNRLEAGEVVYGVLEVDAEAPSVAELEAASAPAASVAEQEPQAETGNSFAVTEEPSRSL